MKRTLEALGLKHHQAEVVHADHPALRGMLQQVRHLVEVTTATGSEGVERKPRGKKSDATS
jgi:ribosomal protein L30